MYFNAFLTGNVEVRFWGKIGRFMVLVSKIMRRKETQLIRYRHLKKYNSLGHSSWAIRRQFWQVRDIRAPFLKAQSAFHLLGGCGIE